MNRPSWDDYFLDMMHQVAQRATCDRGRSGCILVQNRQIIATGYVGSPPGLPHCDDVGHLMKQVIDEDGGTSRHCLRTIHAEQNAICQAARHGTSVEGATLYCRMEPCRTCAMLILATGIERVVCEKRYHAAQETREMFAAAGVELTVRDDYVQSYDDQA
jgi:dCMP deaminase